MTPLISLDDEAALDPAIVGVKAANLAKARQHGLPVLPGVVVPIEIGQAAIELGLETLRAAGPGKARLAVDRARITQEVAEALPVAAATFGEGLILRSSTTLDDDDRFSGAFASIADVRPDEVTSAVRGCWSSLFSADSLARMDAAEIMPDGIGVAVLIQRTLDPELGGSADLQDDGSVCVAAVAGRPGPLFAGAVRGVPGVVTHEGDMPAQLRAIGLSAELGAVLTASAEGALAVGCRRMEWAVEAGRLWVLQLDPAAAANVFSDDTDGAGQGTPVFRGSPASAGLATGRVLRVESTEEAVDEVDGCILVVDQALAAYAPLLYRAAGLICFDGSPASHLCTVARSLHVPAVVGLQSFNHDLRALLANENLSVVVNGNAGTVRPIGR